MSLNFDCGTMRIGRILPCSIDQLNLDVTLKCGQAFRWKKNDLGEWTNVLGGRVWFLKQDPEGNIQYRAVRAQDRGQTEDEAFLRDYFQLDVDLVKLYNEWAAVDPTFEAVAKRLPGIRILRQDPFEALIAFICSSNNNITRITKMVNNLCENYGTPALTVGSESYFAFPRAEALDADRVAAELRSAGFGYRAEYVRATARELSARGPLWLESLRQADYEKARMELCKLPGVGPKVADCVCLMALDKADVVPVDIHVWRITVRDYLPHLAGNKTLTDKVYREVGQFFREKFGPYAGWAHSVLFTADLKSSKLTYDPGRAVKRGKKKCK